MQFEWNSKKEETNIKKHHIDFTTASFVFDDENRIEIYDEAHSNAEEERYITIGLAGKVLFVVYTTRCLRIRMISARLANPMERRAYYGDL